MWLRMSPGRSASALRHYNVSSAAAVCRQMHMKADADIAESVLAHDKRNRVQQAYERTCHLEARVKLMQAWATYLEPEVEAMALAA